MPKFNGVELTQESIKKTRKWFSDNAMTYIEESKNNRYKKMKTNSKNLKVLI